MNPVTPLVRVTLAWVIGLALGRVFPHFPFWLAFSTAVWLVTLFRRHNLLILAAIALLGAARYTLPPPGIQTTQYLTRSGTLSGRITGEIRTAPDILPHGLRYRLALRTLNGARLSGAVLLNAQTDDLRPGDVVEFAGEIRPTPRDVNPDSPDWDEYLLGRGICGFVSAGSEVQTTDHKFRPWLRFVGAVRSFFNQRLARLGPDTAFGRALVLGVSAPWDQRAEHLRDAGLAHLIAVSGMHVAIIALVLGALLGLVIRRREPTRVAVVILVFLYAAVCDFQPAAFRAAVMIALYEISRLLQRRVSANHLLAGAVLTVTAFSPIQAFQAGLQLSVLCVWGLINLIPEGFPGGVFSKTRQPWRRWLNEGAQIGLWSAILSLLIAPVTLLHFHQATLNGVLGNLAGIPLFGVLLPLALLITILPVGILHPYLMAFGLILRVFDGWAGFCARLPFRIAFIPFSNWQFFIAAAGLVALGLALRRRDWRFTPAVAISLALLVFLRPVKPDHLRITFFDVGLGDCALVEDGPIRALVDTGDARAFHGVVLPYLQAHGIDRLDLVVISHAHEDHTGGLGELLRDCRVEQLVTTGPTLRDLQRDAAIDCPVDTLCADRTTGAVHWRFYPPDERFAGVNDESLVARIDDGAFSGLFTGDLQTEREKEMLDSLTPVVLLKAAHHGSHYGTSAEFLDRVQPRVAVISAPGRDGFPASETLLRLTRLFERVFVTGTEGAVIVDCDGKMLRVHGFGSGRSTILRLREE
jgi:competence protein ComEC